MANGAGKHKLLVIGPSEPWSVREKLCLATSVMKCGDQNWVSVSRAIKPFAEPWRPPDWFSQKHCASKYSELLETTEAPKRKRGEKGEVVETAKDVIVRRLTAERIDELKTLIKETQEKHRKLKKESELMQAGHLDSKLEELWEEILQKKKREEEEAELKKRNMTAAYQARLVAKTPRRVPGSLGPNVSPDDPVKILMLDLMSTKNASGSARLVSLAESVNKDMVGLCSVLDDPNQKKLLGQRGTPPSSPLLSELLKKGSILANNSRLMEADGVNTAAQHLSQATGAPMLSRLLEAGPTHFSAQFGFTVGPNSACSSAVSAETAAVNSAASAYPELDVMEPSIPVSEGKKESELHEEDITMCYMGDELDLKTVGEIIAIIEDKADEATEALDAAAVENALSLCEENSQSLSVVWTSAAFQVQQDLSRPKNLADNTGGFRPQGGTSALPFTSSSSSCNSRSSENCYTEAGPQPEAGTGSEQMLHQKNLVSLDIAVKCENEQWSQQRLDADSVLEDSPLTERHLQEMRPEDRRQDVSGTKRVNGDVNRPELCGEDEAAEGFLSEDREAEPAASESEDGYSLTASSALQLQAVADSAPSSPASSHFSVCNEDLEALQAQKIWKKAIMLVWRAAANHRYANVFLQPVTDEIAPGYHSIVQRPIDLATIKKNIETSLIRTTAEFQRDILLMFQNAIMYNSLDHNVYHMALEMQQDVLEQIQQFLATQLIMETSESGISTKSLRGRESTHKQDPTDKEIVSMSSPAFLLSLFDRGTRGRRCAIDIDLKMKK